MPLTKSELKEIKARVKETLAVKGPDSDISYLIKAYEEITSEDEQRKRHPLIISGDVLNVDEIKREEREEIIKILEGMKKEGGGWCSDLEHTDKCSCEGDQYNQALSDAITRIKERDL